MLKKKNIAMVMAAATVATSVAPVFAAIETQNVDEATLIAKVEEMLNTKYTDSKISNEGTIQAGEEYKNSVYKIETTYTASTGSVTVRIDSVETLKAEIEKAKVDGRDLTLNVTDKGHKEVDGQIVNIEVTKNRYYGSNFVDTVNVGSGDTAQNLTNGSTITAAPNAVVTITGGTAKIALTSGVEIELVEGDYVLDLTKPVDANGNEVVVTDGDTKAEKQIVGFKLAEDSADAKIKTIAAKRVADLVITSNVEVEKELSKLVTEQGYTREGAELVNLLVSARDAESASPVLNNGTVDYVTVVKDGVRYSVRELDENTEVSKVTTVKDGYELTIKLQVKQDKDKLTAKSTADTNVKIVVKSDSQSDLAKLRTAIMTGNKVVPGNVTALAGDDRFETAVAVSKQAFIGKSDIQVPNTHYAKSIVLVGKDAIVDGLAAAPLAAQKEAPILFTNKDEVPASTMAEIKRLVKKGTDIYLVGGENTISKEVEAQLIKEMNANIIRLEGADRFETSIAIAEELGTDINSKAYVVGGTGLADAMSVAALAAADSNGATTGNKVTPIIVTPKDGLTKDAKNYLKTNTVITDVEVVGGESHASTEVLKNITSIENTATGSGVNITATRIAGSDRNDTNAKVIKSLGASNVTNFYIAKDGDTQLIDALAAAPLAGRNGGVIVLATNDTAKAQDDAIKTVKAASGNELTQVGNGVADTLVQKIAKFLGL